MATSFNTTFGLQAVMQPTPVRIAPDGLRHYRTVNPFRRWMKEAGHCACETAACQYDQHVLDFVLDVKSGKGMVHKIQNVASASIGQNVRATKLNTQCAC
jgi:hypothetical protein